MPLNLLSILVGANGTGKSCMLNALSYFFRTDLSYDERDFYNTNAGPIRITITFSNLTNEEAGLFHPYLAGDNLTFPIMSSLILIMIRAEILKLL